MALSLLLNREAAIIADTKDHPSKEYDLEANARFLGQSFQIYSQENLLPKQASLWISKPPP